MDGPLPQNSVNFSANPIGYENEINPTKSKGARSFFCSSCRKRRRRSKLPAAQDNKNPKTQAPKASR
jgi:hypothetical protein